jgi:hypothetical protein
MNNRRRKTEDDGSGVTLAKSVAFRDDHMELRLRDGRIVRVPLNRFPSLHKATPEQRALYKIGAKGQCIHWPEIEIDLPITSILACAVK